MLCSMEINIKSVNFEIDKELEEYIKKRIGDLEKYLSNLSKRKGFNIRSSVSIEKITSRHLKGPFYEVKCRIFLPKRDLIARVKREDPKIAIDEVKNELKIEIEKYKGGIESLKKRRARALKKFLHLSSLARFWRKGRIRDEGR